MAFEWHRLSRAGFEFGHGANRFVGPGQAKVATSSHIPPCAHTSTIPQSIILYKGTLVSVLGARGLQAPADCQAGALLAWVGPACSVLWVALENCRCRPHPEPCPQHHPASAPLLPVHCTLELLL